MGISFAGLGGGSSSKIEKAELFNATGSWTAPASVNYVKVALVSGGGGSGRAESGSDPGSTGGSSGFDTTNHQGALGSNSINGWYSLREGRGSPGAANTGVGSSGATQYKPNSSYYASTINPGQSSNTKWFGQAVTPGSSYTVTVGAGGSGAQSSWGNGGSGYVTVTYYEEE